MCAAWWQVHSTHGAKLFWEEYKQPPTHLFRAEGEVLAFVVFDHHKEQALDHNLSTTGNTATTQTQTSHVYVHIQTQTQTQTHKVSTRVMACGATGANAVCCTCLLGRAGPDGSGFATRSDSSKAIARTFRNSFVSNCKRARRCGYEGDPCCSPSCRRMKRYTSHLTRRARSLQSVAAGEKKNTLKKQAINGYQ